MGDKLGLRFDDGVGDVLSAFARDILREARAAIDDAGRNDAVAVHDFRKAMKRWRAVMRLLEPFVGDDAGRWRLQARDLARELAEARDGQAALDALADLSKAEDGTLSGRSLATIRGRVEDFKQAAETTTLTDAARDRLRAALSAAAEAVQGWPLDRMAFTDLAGGLAKAYARARRAVPPQWRQADAEELHGLRQRVVVHRYQMELMEPLWPRLGKSWTGEAQRLRERLGTCQDLAVLARLTAAHQPLARWRARLAPLIETRKALHVAAAARLAGRLFAERPKAFRRRMEALWESRDGAGKQ
jgi:CHAD domain-containing protein